MPTLAGNEHFSVHFLLNGPRLFHLSTEKVESRKSSTFRSATEENDSGGYVAVPCPSHVKQRSSTAHWLKF